MRIYIHENGKEVSEIVEPVKAFLITSGPSPRDKKNKNKNKKQKTTQRQSCHNNDITER
jgi:hypothetical protein